MVSLRIGLIVLLCCLAGTASAGCASLVASMCPQGPQAETMTARFVRMPVRPPAYAVGEVFPVANHSLLMNPARYGLPPVDGNWRYYRIAPDVFRVDVNSGEVLEVVSEGNRRMLR